MEVVYPYGCRHPSSSKGSWDRALVVAKEGDHLVIGRFEHGVDYVGNYENPDEAYDLYSMYRDNGWVAMDEKDILQTAGLVVKKSVPWYVGVALLAIGVCWAWKAWL